ncbi:hypothetical protein CVT26_005490 [Gymnopilus dilepis]|uniref:Uncharacterized protein n=1 Tax=Gymnopilus dilepis TaxID=231916 RepID=A0A409X2X1_9AGAR|nr:hypothetical protein CVT26_005490 [Gymnopilus dilepis]
MARRHRYGHVSPQPELILLIATVALIESFEEINVVEQRKTDEEWQTHHRQFEKYAQPFEWIAEVVVLHKIFINMLDRLPSLVRKLESLQVSWCEMKVRVLGWNASAVDKESIEAQTEQKRHTPSV